MHVGAGVEEMIRKTVEREARRYGASMSFVISVALADYFGISLKHDEDYRAQPKGTAPVKPAAEAAIVEQHASH